MVLNCVVLLIHNSLNLSYLISGIFLYTFLFSLSAYGVRSQSPLTMLPRVENAYMIDHMPMIRTESTNPDTHVNIAQLLFSKLPAGIDIAADTEMKFFK